MLVVDDNSPDGTAALAEETAAELGRIKVLHRAGKQGLGRRVPTRVHDRLRRGLRGDRVDGLGLLARSRRHPDDAAAAVGRRGRGDRLPLRAGWSHRRLAVAPPAAVALGQPVHRVRAAAARSATARRASARIGRDALRAIDPASTTAEGYAFLTELVRKLIANGSTIVETPIVFRDRQFGTSKMSGRIIAESMLLVTKWAIFDRKHIK